MGANFNLLDTAVGDRVLDAKAIAAILAIGNSWFVNEATGSDSNPGTSAAPFATLTAALAAAKANNGDVVYLQGTVHVTATVAWAKNGVSLVSLEAPSNNGRGRISASGATPFSPLVNVTANGCSFIGIGTFHGGFTGATGSQVCWNDAGGRNYYQNCAFQGGGDATTAALAGMRSLTLTGSGESLFEECTLGLDTIVRATNANATLELLSGTARNVFRRCVFQALVSDVSDVHVLVGADGMDRYAIFEDCSYSNAVNSTGSTMSAAFSVNAAAGGSVFVQGGMSVGATAIATAGPVYVNNALGATTSSVGLLAT